MLLLTFFFFCLIASAQEQDPQRTIFLSIPGDVRLTNKDALLQQINSMDSACVEHISIAVYEKSYEYQNGKNVYPEFFCVYDTYLQNLGEVYELIPWKNWKKINEITLPFADSISPNYLTNIRRYFTLKWTFGIIYPYTANYEKLPIKDLQIGKPAFAALNSESLSKIPSRLQRFSLPTVSGVTEIPDFNYIGIELDNWNRLSEYDLTPIRLGNFENVNVTLNPNNSSGNGLNLNLFTSAKNLCVNSGNAPRFSEVSFELDALKQLKRLTVNGEFWGYNPDGTTKGNILSVPNLEVLVVSNYKKEEQKFEGSLNNSVFTTPQVPVSFWNPLFITSIMDIRCPALKYLNVKTNYLFPIIDQCPQLKQLVLSTSNLTLSNRFTELRNLKEIHLIAVDSNANIHVRDTSAFPYATHFTFEQHFPLIKASISNDTIETIATANLQLNFLHGAPLQKIVLKNFHPQVWNTVLSLQQLDTLELSVACIAEINEGNLWGSLSQLKTLGSLVLHTSTDANTSIPSLEQLRAVLSKETDIVFVEACR